MMRVQGYIPIQLFAAAVFDGPSWIKYDLFRKNKLLQW